MITAARGLVWAAVWAMCRTVCASPPEVLTLADALEQDRIRLEQATPSGGYSRFRIEMANPTGRDIQIDPYGAAFDPPAGERSQRVGIGLPLSIDGRPLNLRRQGLSSEPTEVIPVLTDDASSLTKATGAVAAGTLALLGIVALGRMGGGSWTQDLAEARALLERLSQIPPPLEGPDASGFPLDRAPIDPPPAWPPSEGSTNEQGKVWCQPPWDKGGPYWMDPEEYANLRSQQSAGKAWDDRYGWVAADERAGYHQRDEASRAAAAAESRELADRFAQSQRRLNELAAERLQYRIADAVQKAQDEGFSGLSEEDRSLLRQADEETKARLRGEPIALRSYEKRVVEHLVSQKAIDDTAWALGWAKSGTDFTLGLVGSYCGTPGKIVGTSYTMLSNTLGSMSEGAARFNSGLSTASSWSEAAQAGARKGAWEGVQSVIVDEIAGAVSKPVSGWVAGKINSRLAVSEVLGAALENRGVQQGLSGGLLQQSVEGGMQTIHERVKETTEWAMAETTKYIGGKTYEKLTQ